MSRGSPLASAPKSSPQWLSSVPMLCALQPCASAPRTCPHPAAKSARTRCPTPSASPPPSVASSAAEPSPPTHQPRSLDRTPIGKEPRRVPIIAVSNQKGGVGKTTSTLNLGAALREMGKTVLLVDLDPQGSLTVAAGVLDVDAIRLSIGDLLMARAQNVPQDVRKAIIKTPAGLDLVPGNGMLSAAELTLATAMARESALLVTLKPALDHYDYILIDCLPSLR